MFPRPSNAWRVATLSVALVGGCGPARNNDVSQTSQAIVHGEVSGADQDATLLLVLVDRASSRRLGVCTATLVAPRLVLTARHCVAKTDTDVACSPSGEPVLGGRVLGNRAPEDIFVFAGPTRAAFTGDAPPELDMEKWQPDGQGAEILDDGATTLCDHDIAFVRLKEPILNVTPALLRLDSGISPGESLVTVGWGVTSMELEPRKRQQRRGVTVKRVGPSDELPILTKSEVLFDESICLGDSGGPVFAQGTGAVIGVVSRGGNGLEPHPSRLSETCEDAENVATQLAPFAPFVRRAFDRAGATPRIEPVAPPDDACRAYPAKSSRTDRVKGLTVTAAFAVGALVLRRGRKRHAR